jgi:hypothetical protein
MAFSLSLLFSLQQNQRTIGCYRFCLEGGGGSRRMGEVAQIMYTHVSKCKNDKINKKQIKKKHKGP